VSSDLAILAILVDFCVFRGVLGELERLNIGVLLGHADQADRVLGLHRLLE